MLVAARLVVMSAADGDFAHEGGHLVQKCVQSSFEYRDTKQKNMRKGREKDRGREREREKERKKE
jgi:hypothetical protein